MAVAPAVKLFVGLGNPGPSYAHTRHNAGVWFIERLLEKYAASLQEQTKFHGASAKLSIDGHDCYCLVPHTYMNESGRAVASLAKYFKITPAEILVAHDELDLPVGSTKLKVGGGHGGHNGLRDIIKHLSGADFARLRIGIDHPGQKHLVTDYVLHAPPASEYAEIQRNLGAAVDVVDALVAGNMQAAMRRLHPQRVTDQGK